MAQQKEDRIPLSDSKVLSSEKDDRGSASVISISHCFLMSIRKIGDVSLSCKKSYQFHRRTRLLLPVGISIDNSADSIYYHFVYVNNAKFNLKRQNRRRLHLTNEVVLTAKSVLIGCLTPLTQFITNIS